MNIEEKLVKTITDTVKTKFGYDPEEGMVMIEIPKDKANGDYSTNIAMRLTKKLSRKPQEIASELVSELNNSELIESASVAGPGFINLRLNEASLCSVVEIIRNAGFDYAKDCANGLDETKKSINLEYISANPTGPMHVGHGR